MRRTDVMTQGTRAVDWQIGEFEGWFEFGGERVEMGDDHRPMVRMDTGKLLGCPGAQYEIVQNSEMIAAVQAFAEEAGGTVTRSGAIDGGKICIAEARLGEIEVAGDDSPHYMEISAAWGHGGRKGNELVARVLREWCSNGATVMVDQSAFRFRHTKGASDRLIEIVRSAPEVIAQMRNYANLGGQLAQVRVDAEQTGRILSTVFTPPASESGRAATRYETRIADIVRRISGTRGTRTDTAWGLYQGITEHVDHGAEYRGRDDRRREENRTMSTTFGTGAQLKARALDVIVETLDSDILRECLAETRNPSLDSIVQATEVQAENHGAGPINLADFIA